MKIIPDADRLLPGARIQALLAVAAVLACALTASCGGRQDSHDGRDGTLAAALAAVDDSMAVNFPNTVSMIHDGMRRAADSLDYYDWYLRLMRYEVSRNVPDTSRLQWGKAYAFLSGRGQTPRVRGMKGFLLNVKGSYYYKLHYEPAKAIHAYREACSQLAGSDCENNLPNVCANLGDAYVAANDMPRAAWWYRRALFLSDSLRLPDKDNVSLYMGLGRIYVNLGDFDSALECYRVADGKFGQMPLNMQLYFLTNYGNYYYYSADYKGAEAVFTRLKRLLEDNGMDDSYEMYVCMVNMADVEMNLGNTAEARRLVDKAHAYFSKIGDETATYYCHTIMIALALKAGDTAEVSRILARERVTATMDFNMYNIRHRYLREYYVRRGDYRRAYEDLEEHNARNDSLKHNIVNMRTSEIMMRYTQDTLQLHHRLEMQEKDADIRSARLGLYVGQLVMVALALLLLYVYTFARKRRLQMHFELMQLRLMNVRSRISPHFIFNVLNNRMAKTGKDDADGLMALVKLIRANLNMSGKYYVSLKEELDFVRYYIAVERDSVCPELDFEVNAPADDVLEGVMVPSMFIQILVENSIKHSLKRRQGAKRLRIDVVKDTAGCRVTVTDNGTGFDIRQSDPSSTKTGLKVIRSTINIINRENKRKIRLGIRNILAADGTVEGCEVALYIPSGLKCFE